MPAYLRKKIADMMSHDDSRTHSVNYSRSICWLRILQVPILMFWTTHLALGITFLYEKALLWQLWFRLIACMKLVGSCRFLTQPKITRLFFGKLREFVELRLHADNGKLFNHNFHIRANSIQPSTASSSPQ